MGVLTGVLAILVVVAILFEIARRIGVPYPTLPVLGGLGLGLLPGLAHIALEPDRPPRLLPPLLFSAAVQTPLRQLRANIAPIARLSIGLVIFTTFIVAVAIQAAIPGLGWAAAFALGTIVAPTDALAATTVFRRLGVPRQISTLIESEALFNDGTALIAYRVAVVAAISGVFVVQDALTGLVVAAAGGGELRIAEPPRRDRRSSSEPLNGFIRHSFIAGGWAGDPNSLCTWAAKLSARWDNHIAPPCRCHEATAI